MQKGNVMRHKQENASFEIMYHIFANKDQILIKRPKDTFRPVEDFSKIYSDII